LENRERVVNQLSAVERCTLMLLYAAGGKVRGKLWYQKEMFELSGAFKDLAEELDFNAYSYGPFSEGLDEYRDMLENSGLIRELKLTEKGREIAEKLWKQGSEREKEIIEGIAKFLENLDDEELLLYIYVTSPQMAEKSDVKEKILQKRVEIALRMLQNRKVSTGLAAKLAGLPLTKLIEEAIKRGVKPFDVQGDVEGEN